MKMKIRSEAVPFDPTFQNIFRWAKIQIGIQFIVNIKNELQFVTTEDALNTFTKYITTNYFNKKNFKHLSWKLPSIPHINIIDTCSNNLMPIYKKLHKRKTYAITISLFKYLSYKITQLCLASIFMCSFLIPYTTLIQQASGQDLPLSFINVNTSQLNSHRQDLKNYQNNLVQNEDYYSKSNYLIQNINIKKIFINQNKKSNVTILNRKPSMDINQTNDFNNKKVHSSNKYSLIILSQSNNYLSLSVLNNKSSTNYKSDYVGGGLAVLESIPIRVKRFMNITKNSPSIHEPNSKIKQGTFDNNDLYPNSHKKFVNKKKLQKLIMDGLGLKKLPDMKKANISQLEYATKYIEYLDRLKKSGNTLYLNDSLGLSSASLQMFSVATSSFKDISQKRWRNKRASNKKEHTNQSKKNSYNNDKTNILLHFPLNSSDAPIHYENIDEANVRLMMVYSPSLASLNYRKTRLHTDITKFGSGTEKNSRKINHLTRKKFNCNGDQVQKFSIQQKDRNYYRNRNRDRGRSQMLNIKLYQLLPMTKRQLVDSKTIKFETSEYDRTIEDTRSQWLEFDVTDTVRSWLNKTQENLGIEIQCDKCRRIGARILNDFSSSNGHSNQSDDKDGFHLTPVLNIIGQLNSLYHQNNNKSNNYIYHRSNYGHMKKVRKWRNSCFKDHQRCCRHELDVVFKDIKGFEFIIQPKIFDAGFCRGRCPPRHNPAHHHALLQSLIWQQDHNSVPRPCCAPSKLSELEILHVDEDHSDKLKISTWSDMQILECACS